MNTTPKRLRILGNDEIETMYGRPRFTQEERIEYFMISREETMVLQKLHAIKSRLYFILQLGYFKSRHLFFVFDIQDVLEDALYIRDQYFPEFQPADIKISKSTWIRQRRLILDLYKYRNARAKERQQLVAKAEQAARVGSKPIYIFRQLTHYLVAQRIVSPAYTDRPVFKYLFSLNNLRAVCGQFPLQGKQPRASWTLNPDISR